MISEVDPSSPAAETFGKGVVIVAINRQPISNAQDFKRLMGQTNGKAALLTAVTQNGTTVFLVLPAQQ